MLTWVVEYLSCLLTVPLPLLPLSSHVVVSAGILHEHLTLGKRQFKNSFILGQSTNIIYNTSPEENSPSSISENIKKKKCTDISTDSRLLTWYFNFRHDIILLSFSEIILSLASKRSMRWFICSFDTLPSQAVILKVFLSNYFMILQNTSGSCICAAQPWVSSLSALPLSTRDQC